MQYLVIYRNSSKNTLWTPYEHLQIDFAESSRCIRTKSARRNRKLGVHLCGFLLYRVSIIPGDIPKIFQICRNLSEHFFLNFRKIFRVNFLYFMVLRNSQIPQISFRVLKILRTFSKNRQKIFRIYFSAISQDFWRFPQFKHSKTSLKKKLFPARSTFST